MVREFYTTPRLLKEAIKGRFKKRQPNSRDSKKATYMDPRNQGGGGFLC